MNDPASALIRVERIRRRAYLTAASGSVAAHLFILGEQVRRQQWDSAAAYSLGLLVSAWVLVALTWLRWPTARLSLLIVGVATVSTVSEFAPLLRAPEVQTGSYLSFLIMVALWFGLLPRPAFRALSSSITSARPVPTADTAAEAERAP